MNCCNTYGTCTQGRDCPARTGVVLSHQAAHAARVARIKASKPRTCDDLGICQGRGDCACSQPVPPEAGNFQILDLGPDDIDAAGQPMGHDEIMARVRLLLKLAVVVATIVVVLGVATGYATERWADVLWAYLAGVS